MATLAMAQCHLRIARLTARGKTFSQLARTLCNRLSSFRSQLQSVAKRLAADGIFIGTSSWKYRGWAGLLYDEQRYCYRGTG